MLKCPHCGSTDVKWERYLGGVTVDTAPQVYYRPHTCNSCDKEFVVKSDDENPVLAIIKDWQMGGFYADGIGLDDNA